MPVSTDVKRPLLPVRYVILSLFVSWPTDKFHLNRVPGVPYVPDVPDILDVPDVPETPQVQYWIANFSKMLLP